MLKVIAHGIPAIVNEGLGSKELVVEGNGFLVRDWEETINRINEVPKDEKLRSWIALVHSFSAVSTVLSVEKESKTLFHPQRKVVTWQH